MEAKPLEPYVLIADDNADSRDILTTIVESLNVRVVAVSNGLRVMDTVRTQKPSLILLDVLMPGLDGFSVVTQLQSKEETRHIPIIMISAIMERGVLAMPGVVAVVRKADFDLIEVRKQIGELLAEATTS